MEMNESKGLKNFPPEWLEICQIIEKGRVEYRDILIFRNGDDFLLVGYNGHGFLVQHKRRKISLPPDIIKHIKNPDRKIHLELLKQGEENREKSKTDLLISLAEEQCNFFVDEHGDGYASLPIGDSQRVMKIRSKEFKEYLHLLLYQKGKKAPSTETINVVTNLLEGKAKFENERIKLSIRVASKDGTIFYDLGWDDWKIIKITKDGWKIIPHSEPIFKRYAHQLPQVEPAQVGVDGYKLLAKHIPLNKDDEMIFLVHAATFFVPTFPHPIIAPYGPHGSGKTMLFRLIRMLIDPSSVAILSFPKEGREFIQMLAHHYLALFDNVSRITEWQSDALCRAVTGEGQSKRELYTDDDDVIYSFRRCIGLNGINLTADRPDLLDRCIPYQLKRISKTERKQEEKILKEFRKDLPKILGGLLSTISKALEIYPDVEKELTGKPLPRMADFMIWGETIARALGYQPFEFYDKYWEKIQSINREAVESHVVGDLILKLVEKEMENKKEKEETVDGRIKIWEGTPAQLFAEIEQLAEEFKINTKGQGFPRAPHTLMRKLNEIETNLQDEGILLEKQRESNKRTVRIYKRKDKDEKQDGEEDKSGRKSVTSVIASSIRRKSNDAFNDALTEETKSVTKSVIQFTGENDACDGNDAFFRTFSLPSHDVSDSDLKATILSIISTKPRSVSIHTISQKLKEKDLQIDVEKLRNLLMDLCEQGLIIAIDNDFSSFTKPREEKPKKDDSDEGKKKESPENDNNNFLTPEELDLIRKAERIIGDGHLRLIPLARALGKTKWKEIQEISATFNKAMSKPETTLLRRDPDGRFYLDFKNKHFTLLALDNIDNFRDPETGETLRQIKKGDLFSASPEATKLLVGRGLVDIASWESLNPLKTTHHPLYYKIGRGRLIDSKTKGKECPANH